MQPTRWAAKTTGERIGNLVASRLGREIRCAVDQGLGISSPLVKSTVDAFVVDRLVGAVWPSLVILAALLAVHAAGSLSGQVEAERIGTGLAVLAALAWSVVGLVEGTRASAPHLRVWMVTRLPLNLHVRLQLFLEIRERRRLAVDRLSDADSFLPQLIAAAVKTLEERLNLTSDQVAFRFADHLAPVVVRHLALRLAAIVFPIVGALLYYRLAIYPDLIAGATGAGPWAIALYPFAAAVDIAFATSWRLALLPAA